MPIQNPKSEIHNRKKLIEVALPLEKINVASAREKSIRHGHPSTLHLWWARRPLAAARAVIFAQMVDDPSEYVAELRRDPVAYVQAQRTLTEQMVAWTIRRRSFEAVPVAGERAVLDPGEAPTLEECLADNERQRLFRLIEQLVLWENTTNEDILQQARDEIWRSWRRTCADNHDHPRAAELFNPEKLPAFHDPFAGGGALPLEAQRLGLESYASDLNPVAVLINKAMIEIPPKFAGRPPVNPDLRFEIFDLRLEDKKSQISNPKSQITWKGAAGLAADVRYYGQWMRDEAEKRIGYLYPKIEITAEGAAGRRDLQPLIGQKLTVIAWLWARTVNSPNPAFAHVAVPLASTFMLSTKPGKETYVEPVIDGDSYRFTVKVGKPKDAEAAKNGTKLSRGANFRCLLSDTPIAGDYIKAEGVAGRMGARLMAIVAKGERGRIYLAPTPEHEAIAKQAQPEWVPETPLPDDPRNFWTVHYGLTTFGDLFTPRQLVALNTFADLVQEARERVKRDMLFTAEDAEERREAGDLPLPLRSSAASAVDHDLPLAAEGDAFFTAEGAEERGDLIFTAEDAEERREAGHLPLPLRSSAASAVDHDPPLAAGGTGATAYADAVAVYLAFAISRSADRGSNICSWDNSPKMEALRNTFGRQAIPMVWDFAEGNPLSESSGNWMNNVEWGAKTVACLPAHLTSDARQVDATNQTISKDKIVSTDPPYCLASGTLIMTSLGYAPIEQIRVGDQVLTHHGRFARVTQTYQRPYQGMLQQIKVAHTSQPLLITDEHPIYAVQTGACRVGYAAACHLSCAWMRQNNGCSARVADQYQLAWVESAKVKPTDLVFTPVLQPDLPIEQIELQDWLPAEQYLFIDTQLHYHKATPRSLASREQVLTAPRRYTTNTTIAITPELGRLLGYFVADGYAQVSHDGGAIHFTFHTNETDFHADVTNLMEHCFELKAGKTTDNAYQYNHSVRLNFYSKPIATLLRTWCYTADGHKCLPDWLLHLDDHVIKAFLRGYWFGDGSCSVKEAIASSNSPALIGQLRLLLQRIGIMARLHIRQIKPTLINRKMAVPRGLQYTLHITGTALTRLIDQLDLPIPNHQPSYHREQHGAWWAGGYLLPIRKIELVAYSGMVYNLETEDHSYVTAAGCVHNCDNISYADLSDFFYVWLRRTLRTIFPDLFSTLAVPKAEELIANPYRQGGKESSEAFFYNGMALAMRNLSHQTHPAFPITIYYAYKQQETNASEGTSSTGWDGFLTSVIESGFAISGTWPIRTELSNRMIGSGTNALASSIVLVCRPRPLNAPTVTRRDFLAALKDELPVALANMQRGNIAPVDLAQASIGPGMGVFTRYGKVIDATGKALTVREALTLINQSLDEVLAEQEGDFDADTRWALAWFEQYGFAEGEYGVAETLSKAKNTSVAGMVNAGLLAAGSGKVRLLRPDELPADWNPATDARLTVWEMVHQLVRALSVGDQASEAAAGTLLAQLGGQADVARELAYRLYALCERKKRAAEALAYNGLVQSWPEMLTLAQAQRRDVPVQLGF